MKSAKLTGMLKAWLLVNPQSESADRNVRRLVEILNQDDREVVAAMIREDLKPRLEAQIEALQEQVEQLGG